MGELLGMDAANNHRIIVNGYYQAILRTLLDPEAPFGLAKYLKSRGEWFIKSREVITKYIVEEKRAIETGNGHSPHGYVIHEGYSCAQVRQEYLKLLAEEAWKEHLQTLKERLAGDFQTDFSAATCEGSIGPLTFSVDDTGKGTISLKKKDAFKGLDLKGKASIKNADFAGASIGVGGSGSPEPFVNVKGDATLFIEKNKSTHQWNGGFALSASLGLGIKRDIRVLGRQLGVGVACYPGTPSVKFYARAFYDHAIDYIKAVMAGQP
jgi:hypothetical protein